MPLFWIYGAHVNRGDYAQAEEVIKEVEASGYEEGEKPGEFLYNIFNREGIFIGRTKLDNMDNNRPTPVKAKKNHLYYLRVKESGYKELVVFKMKWE